MGFQLGLLEPRREDPFPTPTPTLSLPFLDLATPPT